MKSKCVFEENRREFPQLEKCIYLDHAASTFSPKSLLRNVFDDISSELYCNPHSQSVCAKNTKKNIEKARNLVKSFFGADEYDVVFTHNATGALKIVGENFPFSISSVFAHTKELHNSALGIREYAYDGKANVLIGSITDLPVVKKSDNNLFVCAGECNFSGVKMNLENIIEAKQKGWMVLLDAAKLAATSPIHLDKFQPEFVAVSFYKIFGYPSGLGCLLIHKSGSNVLQKKYFSGGNVESVSSQDRFHVFRKNVSERFEDGSVAFLSIISLLHMLETPKFLSITMENISKHCFSLANELYHSLKDLKHYNGNNIAIFYGNHHLSDENVQGSILAFNFLDELGNYIGYSQVEQLCGMENIQLRVGCFCNPGACETWLGLSPEDVKENHKGGHVCWDDKDMVHGKPIGAIRVSFGYCSIKSDSDKVLTFVKKYFVVKEQRSEVSKIEKSDLTHIVVYPIKSCPGVLVSSWTLSKSGLKYDREWTIVDEHSVALKLNKEPKLSLIQPEFDGHYMVMTSPGIENLKISLDELPNQSFPLSVCGTNTNGLFYTDRTVTDWLETVLQRKCHLVRKDPNESRLSKCNGDIKFSNEAPFLLVTRSSLDDLNKMMNLHQNDSSWLITRFRPNFVIENKDSLPYEEEFYQYLTISSSRFSVIDKCNRCTMICVDPITQNVLYEPLKTLSSYKRRQGKINFGILLSGPDIEMEICLKNKIYNF
jgi:molybdenum cofactor sulfurtransferase